MADFVVHRPRLGNVTEHHHVGVSADPVGKRTRRFRMLGDFGGVPSQDHGSRRHVGRRFPRHLDAFPAVASPTEERNGDPNGFPYEFDGRGGDLGAGRGFRARVDDEDRLGIPGAQRFQIAAAGAVSGDLPVKVQRPEPSGRNHIDRERIVRRPDRGGALDDSGSGNHQPMLPRGEVEREGTIRAGARSQPPGAQGRTRHRASLHRPGENSSYAGRCRRHGRRGRRGRFAPATGGERQPAKRQPAGLHSSCFAPSEPISPVVAPVKIALEI